MPVVSVFSDSSTVRAAFPNGKKVSSLLTAATVALYSHPVLGRVVSLPTNAKTYFSSCCVRLFVTSQNIAASYAFSVTPCDRCFSG
jgi:hypothetical protein